MGAPTMPDGTPRPAGDARPGTAAAAAATRPNDRTAAAAHTGTTTDSRSTSIAAPRLTRLLAGAIMIGVMVQAVLAGGFLAGRPALRVVHQIIGHSLGLLGFLLLAAGLIGLRRTREPAARLATRAAIFLAAAITVGAGEMASLGTRDLLMLHIPLAISIMGLADSLIRAGRQAGR